MTKAEMVSAGYFEFFGQAYRFLQDNAGNPSADWTNLCSQVDTLCASTKEEIRPLADSVMFAIVQEIERTSRKEPK